MVADLVAAVSTSSRMTSCSATVRTVRSPIALKAVMREINRHADRTGKKVMYAFNVSGDVDEMRRRHDLVLKHGGTCVMVSVNGVGLAGVTGLRRHSQLVIHGHRNGWGMFDRSPVLGMSYLAYQKFWRVAGSRSSARKWAPQ